MLAGVRARSVPPQGASHLAPSASPAPTGGAGALPGGEFSMGTEAPDGYPADGEGPVHTVMLSAFAIDACAVTNALFAEFVEATGHVSEAERSGSSFVFGGLLPDDFPPTRALARASWWREVEAAN